MLLVVYILYIILFSNCISHICKSLYTVCVWFFFCWLAYARRLCLKNITTRKTIHCSRDQQGSSSVCRISFRQDHKKTLHYFNCGSVLYAFKTIEIYNTYNYKNMRKIKFSTSFGFYNVLTIIFIFWVLKLIYNLKNCFFFLRGWEI